MLKRGKTVAIIFGASAFPNYPSLEPEEETLRDALRSAFQNSYADFFTYLTTSAGLKLDKDKYILDLFNSPLQPSEIINQINDFLAKQNTESEPPDDFIFYYCGHGAYLKEKEYFLALKCTNNKSKEASVLKTAYLVDIIRRNTKDKRNLIILDACYSGGAMIDFANLSDESAAASELLKEEVANLNEEEQNLDSTPSGAILFCAAGPKRWAKSSLETKHTMFSGALIQVLSKGDDRSGPNVSLKRLAVLVKAEIKAAFGNDGVPPQIHVPTQENTDLLQIAYFPNPKFDPSTFGQRLSQLEYTINELRDAVNKSTSALQLLPGDQAAKKVADSIKPVADLAQVSKPAADFEPNEMQYIEYSRYFTPAFTGILIGCIDLTSFLVLLSGVRAIIYDTPRGLESTPLPTLPSPQTLMHIPASVVNAINFLLIIHAVLICISVLAIFLTNRARSPAKLDEGQTIIPIILSILPKPISYQALLWNSVLVIAAVCFVILEPLAVMNFLARL